MSASGAASRSRVGGCGASQRQTRPSHISFRRIYQIDASESKVANLARRPPVPSVRFAPFILPSADHPGTRDDHSTTSLDATEGSSSESSDDDTDEESDDEEDKNRPCETSSPDPATKHNNRDSFPNMTFSPNPLAPRHGETSLSGANSSSSTPRSKPKNVKGTKKNLRTQKFLPSTPRKASNHNALLSGAYFSQLRPNRASGIWSATPKKNVVSLVSEDEDEDESPGARRSNMQSDAPQPSSCKLSLDYILNKSPAQPPASLPAEQTTPAPGAAQKRHVAFEPTASNSSEPVIPSDRSQTPQVIQEKQQTPTGQAVQSNAAGSRDQSEHSRLPTISPLRSTVVPKEESPALSFADFLKAQNFRDKDQYQRAHSLGSSDQLTRVFTRSSHGQQQQQQQQTPTPTPTAGAELSPSTPSAGRRHSRQGPSSSILQAPRGNVARRSSDMMAVAPAELESGSRRPVSGLSHPSDAAALYQQRGPPMLVPAQELRTSVGVIDSKSAEVRVKQEMLPIASSLNKVSEYSHTRKPIPSTNAKSTPIVGKAGSRYRYGVSKFDSPSLMAQQRRAANYRDLGSELDLDHNFVDAADDGDDDEDLLALVRSRRRPRGDHALHARPRGSTNCLASSSTSQRGHQTRPATSLADILHEAQGERQIDKNNSENNNDESESTLSDNYGVTALPVPGMSNDERDAYQSVMLMRLQKPKNVNPILQHAEMGITGSSVEAVAVGSQGPDQRADDERKQNQSGPRRAHGGLERLQHKPPAEARKRKTGRDGDKYEEHQSEPKRHARQSARNDTVSARHISRAATHHRRVTRESSDEDVDSGLTIGTSLDGACDDIPYTQYATTKTTASLLSSQRAIKSALSLTAAEFRQCDFKPTKSQSATTNSHLDTTLTLTLRFKLTSNLKRMIIMGNDPEEPVETKCYLLQKVQRSLGPGHIELPLEVREIIYRFLLLADRPIEVHNGWSLVRPDQHLKLCSAILRSCHQVHDEAARVLYSENTFQYALDERAPMNRHMTSSSMHRALPIRRYRRRLRKMKLDLRDVGGIDEDMCEVNISEAIYGLRAFGVTRLEKLTLTMDSHIELDDGRHPVGRYFRPDSLVATALKEVRAGFIQVDLRAYAPERRDLLRAVVDKRVDFGMLGILRQMHGQTGEVAELSREERLRLAVAQHKRQRKDEVDRDMEVLCSHMRTACMLPDRALKLGWFTKVALGGSGSGANDTLCVFH